MYFLALLIVMIPSKVDGFVVSHDLAIMFRIFKLVCINKQRYILSSESGEHARNGGYMNIFDLEFDLEPKKL